MRRQPHAQQATDERSGRYAVDQFAETGEHSPICELEAARLERDRAINDRILATCTLLLCYLAAIALAVIVVVNWARHA
jgi:hypothetical protein